MSGNWYDQFFGMLNVFEMYLLLRVNIFIGTPALLVVANNEGDIFFVDPYKSHENLFKYSAVTIPSHKIHSIDVLWTINSTYLFWSDHNSKALYSTVIDKSNQTTRDVNTAKKIVSKVADSIVLFPVI